MMDQMEEEAGADTEPKTNDVVGIAAKARGNIFNKVLKKIVKPVGYATFIYAMFGTPSLDFQSNAEFSTKGGKNGSPTLKSTTLQKMGAVLNGLIPEAERAEAAEITINSTTYNDGGEYTGAMVQEKVIPTLSEWGMILMVLLMSAGAVHSLKRKKLSPKMIILLLTIAIGSKAAVAYAANLSVTLHATQTTVVKLPAVDSGGMWYLNGVAQTVIDDGSSSDFYLSLSPNDASAGGTNMELKYVVNNKEYVGADKVDMFSANAPVISMTGTALAYTEGDGAVAVDGALTITDGDSTDLTGATVSISGNFTVAEDALSFTNQNGITGSYNATTGILVLSGSATVAEYEAALRSITYNNTSDNPNLSSRTIQSVVTDGVNDSAVVTRQIDVAGVDDAPEVANAIGDVAVVETGDPSGAIDLSSVFTDKDNTDSAITKGIVSNSDTSVATASVSGDTLNYTSTGIGTTTVTVQGESNSKTVNDSFDITITPVTTTLDTIADQAKAEGGFVDITVSITNLADTGSFFDAAAIASAISFSTTTDNGASLLPGETGNVPGVGTVNNPAISATGTDVGGTNTNYVDKAAGTVTFRVYSTSAGNIDTNKMTYTRTGETPQEQSFDISSTFF